MLRVGLQAVNPTNRCSCWCMGRGRPVLLAVATSRHSSSEVGAGMATASETGRILARIEAGMGPEHALATLVSEGLVRPDERQLAAVAPLQRLFADLEGVQLARLPNDTRRWAPACISSYSPYF